MRYLLKKFNRGKTALVAVVILVMASFAWAPVAQAGILESVVAPVVGWIAGIIIGIEGAIIWLLTSVLLWIIKYNDFVNASAVQIGWTLVRDIANLFFVVILLVIALATILRVESYNFKRLLPKLIIMAILVNFSLTIAGLIIDAAQVVMMTFVAAFAGVGGDANLVSALKINEIINYEGKTGTIWTLASTALLAMIMLLITIIVILVILVVIVMRIIMLWILVVLSPLAYILAAFPQGQRYAQQWWQEFTKYVIIGPILAFFLWLTFAIASQGTIVERDFKDIAKEIPTKEGMTQAVQPGETIAALKEKTREGAEASLSTESAITEPSNFVAFIIAIGMLMGGLMITQQMGVAGGQFAGQMMGRIRQAGLAPLQKLGKVAQEAGGLVSRWGARQFRKGGAWRLAALVSPRVIKEGIAAARRKAEWRAYPAAIGAMHDFINRYNPVLVAMGKRRFTNYERQMERATIGEEERELEGANLTEVELAHEYEKAKEIKDYQRVAAIRRRQSRYRQEDDYFAAYKGGTFRPESHMQDAFDLIKIFGRERAGELEADLETFRESAERFRGIGMLSTGFDRKTGKVKHELHFDPASYMGEAQVRLNRGDMERFFLANLEGKNFREFYGGTLEELKENPRARVINFSTGEEVITRFGDATTIGVSNYKILPREGGLMIKRRGQRAQPRKKEVAGFVDGMDPNTGQPTGKMEFTSPATWIEAFRRSPDTATGLLANIGASHSTIYVAYKIAEKAARELNDKEMAENVHRYFEAADDTVANSPELTSSVQRGEKEITPAQQRSLDSISRIYEDKEYAEADFGPGFEKWVPVRIEVAGKPYGSAAATSEQREKEKLGLGGGVVLSRPMAAFIEEGGPEPVIPGGILGVRSAKTKEPGQQVGLGVDFASEHFKDLDLGGKANIGQVLRAEKKDQAVAKIMDYYRKFLEDTTKMAQNEIDREVEGLGNSLKQAGSIRLTNITNPQWQKNKFAIARHELAHRKVDELSDEQLEEILGTLDPAKREKIDKEYQRRFKGMSRKDLNREQVTDMIAGYNRPEADQAKHPAIKVANEETVAKMKETGLIRERKPGEVVAEAIAETEQEGKILKNAIVSGDVKEIVTALNGIQDTLRLVLGGIQAQAEKKPDVQPLAEALGKLSNDIQQQRDNIQAGQRLDPQSTNALLYNINKNLKDLGEAVGEKSPGRMPPVESNRQT